MPPLWCICRCCADSAAYFGICRTQNMVYSRMLRPPPVFIGKPVRGMPLAANQPSISSPSVRVSRRQPDAAHSAGGIAAIDGTKKERIRALSPGAERYRPSRLAADGGQRAARRRATAEEHRIARPDRQSRPAAPCLTRREAALIRRAGLRINIINHPCLPGCSAVILSHFHVIVKCFL